MSSDTSICIGAHDAEARFSELLGRVESGEQITITRHGTPVAKLVPISKSHSEDDRRRAIERIKRLSKDLSLDGLRLRDLIAEGRR